METIKDIVEELRKVAKMYLEGGNDSGSVFEMMSVYADRIEKAYKSQLTSGTMCTMECVSIGGELNQLHDAIKEMSGTIAEYRAENERLKTALNPILEVRPRIRGDYVKYKCWDPDEMMETIVESQRIYNGGES